MMNIEAAKIKIIQFVAELQNETILKQLLTFLASFKQKDSIEPDAYLKQENALLIARTPTPASVSLETLRKEQSYSMERLNQAYAHLDRSIWEGEDIGELLNAI